MRETVNRRTFLKKTVGISAGVIGFPYIVGSSALGKDGSPSANNQITVACVGVGWQGSGNMNGFLGQNDVRVVAVCDIDADNLENARKTVNKKYRNEDCQTYTDYRRMFERKDIDAVMLALPDHWHGLVGVAAARSGKDIYGEKPLTHNLREGRVLCDAVKQYGRIWQTGSWQRSVANFRFACELVLNGRIGKVSRVEVGLPAGQHDYAKTKHLTQFGPAPAELDYDTWLGPAPWAPYCPARVHKNWRWHLDYGGGQLMDWVGHHVDIAHWGLGLDYSGPVEIEGVGE